MKKKIMALVCAVSMAAVTMLGVSAHGNGYGRRNCEEAGNCVRNGASVCIRLGEECRERCRNAQNGSEKVCPNLGENCPNGGDCNGECANNGVCDNSGSGECIGAGRENNENCDGTAQQVRARDGGHHNSDRHGGRGHCGK